MAESFVMKKTKIRAILAHLLTEKKIRVAELARRTNVPQPTIHRIATGACEHPHLSTLTPIADFFSITVNQLKGLDPLNIEENIKLPLLTWEQIAEWPGNKRDCNSKNELILTDANVSSNAYALKVEDSSMDPVFPKNTILITDPAKEAKDRNYVIAKIQGHPRPIFRQLILDAQNKYLKPLNPDLERYKMAILKNNDKILSIVVQAIRDCEE